MKRYILFYASGQIEQCSELDGTLLRLISNRVLNHVIDTKMGVLHVANEKNQVGTHPIPDVDPETEANINTLETDKKRK
jgi:hypothetical protein